MWAVGGMPANDEIKGSSQNNIEKKRIVKETWGCKESDKGNGQMSMQMQGAACFFSSRHGARARQDV